jgi:tetratricopeptide (TPR) repeat protein
MRCCLKTVFLMMAPALVHAQVAQTDATEQLLKQAIAMHQSGNIEGAIPGYEQYLKVHPDSPMALSNLGAAYARAGRYEDAIAQYKHALKLQPNNVPIELNLALAWYKSGDTEQSAPLFEKVHKAAPGQLQPALLLADCWLAMGKNKEVTYLLTPFAGGKPANPAVEYALGTALVRDNQVARGQAFIERILRGGNSAEGFMLMGTTKLSVSDFAGALEDLTKAVQMNPGLPDLYSYYGIALLRTGDQKGAVEAFRKELAMNPNDFTANLQMGVLAKMDENFDEALRYLKHSLGVRPGDIGVRYQLAAIDFNSGKVDEARAALEAMVKEAPNFTEAHVTLATVYYRLKRKEDGDKERAIIQKLNAETQEKQPGVRPEPKAN